MHKEGTLFFFSIGTIQFTLQHKWAPFFLKIILVAAAFPLKFVYFHLILIDVQFVYSVLHRRHFPKVTATYITQANTVTPGGKKTLWNNKKKITYKSKVVYF